MSNTKVIAISGFKFSGKDTCANYLIENYGFKKVSFADPLKDMVSELFDVPRRYLDDPDYKESPLTEYPVPTTDKFTSMISNFMVREFRTKDRFAPEVAHLRTENGVLQTFTNCWENLYHTPRSLAILLGSSMRAGDPSFWVNQAVDKIKINIPKAVISDLRYKSEVDQLKEAFGGNLVTIRVNRFDSSLSTDPSELDLNDHNFDYYLENKGTKEELFQKLKELMVKLNIN